MISGTDQSTSSKAGKIRWIIAALLFVETSLNFLDLETLSVVAPILTTRLKLTNLEYARITQVFELAYLIGFVFGGRVIDKLKARRGLAFAMIWWSVAELSHGFAHSARGLMGCRFLMGLAYPGAYLAAAKVASLWYPAQERAVVVGTYTAGATIGATVAPPLVAWLALNFGWQYAFFVPGVAGLAYAVFWLTFYRDPQENRLLSPAERDYILSGSPNVVKNTPPLGVSLRYLLGSRFFWAIFIGRMIGDPPLIFYVYWLPKFLNEARGLDMHTIGSIAWLPFLFADVGSIGGGLLSSRAVRSGVSPVKARLWVMVRCAAVSTLAFTIPLVHSTTFVLGLMSLMTLVIMAWMVNLSTINVDAFPTEMVSTAAGLTTGGVVLGQIMFTYAIGRILPAYSYGPLFLIMSFMAPVAYVVIKLILRGVY